MKAKRFWRKGLLVLFMLAVACISVGKADTTGVQTVRVGYMDYHGFIDRMTDGTYSGYGAEYLAKIAKLSGFHYEYVFGQWSELLQMLENREIDLLCTAQYTPERDVKFEFSAYPIGYTQGLLYTREDNKVLSYEDYSGFDGMNVGVLRDSAMTDLFLKYAGQHRFHVLLHEYDTEEALLSALNAGEIDAMCSEHLANHENLSLLARFGADAYYLISYPGNPFMTKINYALQEVKTDVDFESALFHKYYDSSTAATSLQFTTAEREYIAQSGPIVVALDENRAPISLWDEQRGAFVGICPDVLEQIAQKSGLTFQYVPQVTGMTTVDMLATGKYDIVCGIERDNFTTNEQVDATDAFLESSIVPVGREGVNLNMNGELTVAVPSSFQALQKQLAAQYPNLHLTYLGTNRECLDSVVAGRADLFIQNTHILSLLLQEPRYDQLAILPVEIMTEHTAMALPASEDGTLLSILNKSIAQLDDAAISSSLIEHTFASPYHYTFTDILYKFKTQILIIVLLVLVCFALLIGINVVQHRNETKLQGKNELLAEAVAQADRASVAKSQFLSRMRHEIRTPMNAIVGLTEIAKQHEKDPGKIDKYLDKIAVSSRVLLNILNDVLDMSAIESDKLKIANAEFDIRQVVEGLRTIYEPQCQGKGVTLEMTDDVQHEQLMGDSLRVHQILLNLISNAYKFTEAGGVIRVRVRETAVKGKTAFLRFIVSDTGSGMTADMKARLFKPFEQETAGTAQKHGGSGLGLSIAKNLVDMMHGVISVESAKGVGTTFTVDLPFEIVERDAAVVENMLKGLRVLVVDDDKGSREYSAIVLRRMGVGFDTAEDGQKALRLFDEAARGDHPYDACLIDWRMAEMDGLALTRELRARERKHTRILLVSAQNLDNVREEALAAGVDSFIAKPLFQSTVFNALMMLTEAAPPKPTTDPSSYDFTGHRVLLVEDQPLNAEIATELLSFVHMEADHAENGQQAVERFAGSAPGTYDLILMDVQMPGMDGYEATGAIRALPRPDAKTIPIFAMTANAFTEDVSAALSAGMNGHISKPINTKLLYETLRKTINQASQGG